MTNDYFSALLALVFADRKVGPGSPAKAAADAREAFLGLMTEEERPAAVAFLQDPEDGLHRRRYDVFVKDWTGGNA